MSSNYSDYEKLFIRLALTKGITIKLFNYLIGAYIDLEQLYTDAKKGKLKIKLSEDIVKRLSKSNDEVGLNKFLNNLKEDGITVVTRLSSDYPMNLREIYDAPNLLFTKGTLANITDKVFTIVGTRRCTRNGYKLADEIAYELASAGVTVVSGMARGIDSAANSAAIRAGGSTVAVLGCGVDICYPPENKELYDKVVETGAVISEYAPGVKPLPGNFPKRNRIMSGISSGVLIIESTLKGGSAITATHALLQGRDVFTGQGGAFLKNAELSNLLAESGCRTITSAKQILNEYGWEYKSSSKNGKEDVLGLDFLQKQIYNLLLMGDATVEEILEKIEAADVAIEDLNTNLMMMELNGIIKRLPGLYYTVT